QWGGNGAEVALLGRPGFLQQRRRRAGGLDGAGGRFQHHLVAAGQGGAQRGQYGVDGQGLHGGDPERYKGAQVYGAAQRPAWGGAGFLPAGAAGGTATTLGTPARP